MEIKHGGKWQTGQSGNPAGRRKRKVVDEEGAIRGIIRKWLLKNLKGMLDNVSSANKDRRFLDGTTAPKTANKLSRTEGEWIWNMLPYAVSKLSYQESKIDIKKLSKEEIDVLLNRLMSEDEQQQA